MATTRVVLNGAGFTALLRSAEVQADLERRANNIAAAAGDGMEVTPRPSAQRARVSVHTATAEARHAEATERVLTRAITAGQH